MKITYVQQSRSESTVDVPAGISVMRGAIDNGIEGIVAECGGSCMCATCHVYVIGGDVYQFATVSDDENEMLDMAAAPREENSRLSCQLKCQSDEVCLRVLVPSEQV